MTLFSFLKRNSPGKINYPRNGDLVSRLFRAEGSADNLLTRKHLFLVVETEGLMWPKGEAQVNNTSWACDVSEGGTPLAGRFTLSLYVVSGKGYDEIAAWLEHGKLTDDYPGLWEIKGGIRLHSIKLRLKS